MDKITSWLFQSWGDRSPDVPFNAAPWLIACGIALFLVFYYNVEARKRISGIRNNRVWKYVLDRVSKQVFAWASVGAVITGLIWLIPNSLFALGLWPTLWIGWGIGIVVYWAIFSRNLPGMLAQFNREVERSKFMPTAGGKRH